MASKKKTAKRKLKHGALSARARKLWAGGRGGLSKGEIARKLGMTKQGVRNAVNARSRIGSKTLMRKEALTPKKQQIAHVRADKKAA